MLLTDTQRLNDELQAEIRRRDEIENQKKMNIAKNAFIKIQWKQAKKLNWKNLRLFLFVLLLNLVLASFAVYAGIDTKFKNWLSELKIYQDIIIITYILIIVLELVGRSYLFNKERLKIGAIWILTVINPNRYKRVREVSEYNFEREFFSQYNN